MKNTLLLLDEEGGIEKKKNCNFRQERQKLVKSPPPFKDALTFLAENIFHVAAELPLF